MVNKHEAAIAAASNPELTREEALKLYDSEIWKEWSLDELALFQLYQSRLCVPFDKFHEAIEHLLGRGVFTHEMADPRTLRLEAEGKLSAPDIHGIIGKLYDLVAQKK
jgi:hypothetical protein